MQIEYLNIDQVYPYENNPRKNDDAVESVAESIKQFGWQQPIVIDKENVIIVGHTRYKAAQKLGYDTIPCIRANELSEEQVKAYRLADNRTSELSYWDFDGLDKELSDITDIDMGDFGFENIYDIPEKNELTEMTKSFKNQELQEENYGDDKFEHKCPRCGFKF